MIRDNNVYDNIYNGMTLIEMPKDGFSCTKTMESGTTQPLLLGLALLAVPHSER